MEKTDVDFKTTATFEGRNGERGPRVSGPFVPLQHWTLKERQGRRLTLGIQLRVHRRLMLFSVHIKYVLIWKAVGICAADIPTIRVSEFKSWLRS